MVRRAFLVSLYFKRLETEFRCNTSGHTWAPVVASRVPLTLKSLFC